MLRLWKSSGIVIAGAVLQHNEEEASKKIVQGNIAYDSRSGWSRAMEYVKAKVKNFTETGKPKSESPTFEEMRRQYSQTSTGWDRLRIIFRKSEYLELDPNVTFIKSTTFIGTICGFFYGGLRDYTKAFNQFIETNDATKFANMNHAKRELSRVGFKAFVKGAYIASIKAFILTGTFITTNTVVSIYRGKSGILEWTVAGAVTSALLRWNLGIRGMISGCMRGGLTGTIMGVFIYCGLKLTGRTLSDVKFITYLSSEKSNKLWEEKFREEEYTKLEKIHAHFTKDLPPGFPAN